LCRAFKNSAIYNIFFSARGRRERRLRGHHLAQLAATARLQRLADLQGSAVGARKRRSSIQASAWTMVAA